MKTAVNHFKQSFLYLCLIVLVGVLFTAYTLTYLAEGGVKIIRITNQISRMFEPASKNVNSQSVRFITLVQVEKQTAQPQQIEPRNSSELQIEYIDLSGCKKPSYLEGYKANCWIACVGGKASCEHESERTMRCFANLHLIGMRKCGTSDFSKWFKNHPELQFRVSDFLYNRRQVCPANVVSSLQNSTLPWDPNRSFYHSGPGALISNRIVSRYGNRLTVSSAAQFIGFMATPQTVFYLQLRNPSDRVISYVYHWHRNGWAFQNVTFEELKAAYVDSLLKHLIVDINVCLSTLGELGCFYSSESRGHDVNVLLLHSIYIIIIKEAFKFIPRGQIILTTTQEYHDHRMEIVKMMTKRFNITYQEEMFEVKKKSIENVGIKNPIWRSTLEMLDEFFLPYNQRLAQLLGDDKWLFQKTRHLV